MSPLNKILLDGLNKYQRVQWAVDPGHTFRNDMYNEKISPRAYEDFNGNYLKNFAGATNKLFHNTRCILTYLYHLYY